MDLLKNLLLKYGKSANLLNDAGGCNVPKKMVDCMIFSNGRHRDRAGRQRRNPVSLECRPQGIIDTV
jgi:hypothetical protein